MLPYRTQSVHFLVLMNSATKLDILEETSKLKKSYAFNNIGSIVLRQMPPKPGTTWMCQQGSSKIPWPSAAPEVTRNTRIDRGNHLFVLATVVLLCTVYLCVWNPKSDDPLKFGFEVLGF